jgi:gas vesicle protein
MAQDPEVIRREIEETRRHMGSTVDALAYKADVPARTKDKVTGAVDSVRERIGGAGSAVADRTPDGEQVKAGAKRAAGVAQENPLGLAIGAAAVGFLAGMLVPSTRVEDEKIGPMADQVKEQVRQTGQEALEHGREIAQEAAGAAKDQVQQSAQEHGEQLKESAQQSAQQATSSTPQTQL